MLWVVVAALVLAAAPALAQTTPSTYRLRPYHGGVVLADKLWRGTIQTQAGKQHEILRREHTVTGDGYFVVDHVEQECNGSLRCYGSITAIHGNVAAPGGVSADSVRVRNAGDGYTIARKTAVRGNDRYGSWGHQINVNRAHAAIAIAGDGAGDGTDRTMLGVWVSEHVLVTDSAYRWNARGEPGEGWFLKMLLPDGRVYGIDNQGILHIKEVRIGH
jgi:hypothetical protein